LGNSLASRSKRACSLVPPPPTTKIPPPHLRSRTNGDATAEAQYLFGSGGGWLGRPRTPTSPSPSKSTLRVRSTALTPSSNHDDARSALRLALPGEGGAAGGVEAAPTFLAPKPTPFAAESSSSSVRGLWERASHASTRLRKHGAQGASAAHVRSMARSIASNGESHISLKAAARGG